jgi:2-oxoglutarate dehydrogenase E2 component (dihydrolipoamide succinyltransferase)
LIDNNPNVFMAVVTMFMPTMGESVMEATILQWLKQEGDIVTEEESILEVATDKVDSEVPTPYAGRLQKVLAKKGEVVKIGAPLAIIVIEGEAMAATSSLPTSAIVLPKPTVTYLQQPVSVPQAPGRDQADGRFYSPLVRQIAQEENVLPHTLSQIPGTGQNNRVTKRDLLAYLQHRLDTDIPLKSAAVQLPITPEDEVIPLDRMRRIIAERMVASKRIVPHVTSFVEADVTDLVKWRNQQKVYFEQKTGVRLTYTPLFLQAIVKAIKDFPMINAFAAEDYIVKKKAIHIGLAVALPGGNLIVPVIKHVDRLGLVELAQKVQAIVHRARHQQLVPDELAEATYTVSNLGSFHNLMGTPIIPQPQVAILALGEIVKKPAVIESDQGDIIAIRYRMYLSHSYDHRVVDGALGGGFAKKVVDYLESFVDWVCW